MGQVHWTEPALNDLRDIVSFVARDSPSYAARLARRISEAPRRLAAFPQLGIKVPELGQPKVRELWVRPYRIIYLVREPDCHVLAVVHGSRDLPDLSSADEPSIE